jgi:hypothetical protein
MNDATPKAKSGPVPKGQWSQALWHDLNRTDIHRSLRKDLRDLYHFYLDDEDRRKLRGMGSLKRGLVLGWWLLKGLVMNLSPGRRVMLLLSVLLLVFGDFNFSSGDVSISLNVSLVSFALVLLILMLELKDKLLARDELEVGRAVQLSLLPAENPSLEGWDIWLFTRPANDVGGDLVDYLPLEGGRLAVFLGDVAGKGLGAALLMAKLQSTLRALAPEGGDLPMLGARVRLTEAP